MEKPNNTYLDELCGDNEKFRQKVVTILKKELPLEIDVYKKEMSKNDYCSAAQAVHKLKHKISILGLEKSYYIASNYEDNLNNNSIALQNDFENILKAMQEFVIEL
jgi:hypothetical protein